MPAPIATPVLDPSLISYLESLGIGDEALAALLDQAAGGLLGAVPPGGQYITSLDYTTLYPALASQYVGEVIQQYESMLGNAPELYQAAVDAGYLTAEQAQAMQTESTTRVGTIQQEFGAKGGLRTLAGPYQARRGEVLQQAIADMQTAANKASTDAYQLASVTTGQRVNALGQAGQIGTALSGQGVARRNAQGMAGGEGGFEIPEPPKPPDQPSLWEKLLLASIPALVGGAGALGGRLLAPGQKSESERLIAGEKAKQDLAKWKEDEAAKAAIPGQIATANRESGTEPFTGGYESVAAQPFANVSPSMSPYEWPMGTASTANPFQTPAPSYQFPTQPAYQPEPSYAFSPGGYDDEYQGYQPYQSSPAPIYQAPAQDFSGWGGWSPGGYDDPWQGYDYGGNSDYTYDPYSWSGDTSGGYWV